MSDATFKQIAGQLGEKYHADGFFPLAYHPQIKKGELWAALLREYKYLYECHTGEPYEDLAELLEGSLATCITFLQNILAKNSLS